MEAPQKRPFLQHTKGKVIGAFVLACIAIGVALTTVRFGFQEMMGTVDELSKPNHKLIILNNLFREITQLDQELREEVITNPGKVRSVLFNGSKSVMHGIDSLKRMLEGDTLQVDRLNELTDVLHQRDSLMMAYLVLRSRAQSNFYSKRLEALSQALLNTPAKVDSTVRTTQKKVVITYYPDTLNENNVFEAQKIEKERSFFSRLLGKKRQPPEPVVINPEKVIKEEMTTTIDTLAIAREDSLMQEMEKIIQVLDREQRTQTRNLLVKELDLIRANNRLFAQMLGLLYEVEEEELRLIKANNDRAALLVSNSYERISLIVLLFLLGMALLVYLIIVDISKSNFYRKQLIKARDEAEQLGLVKQRFLANMSHEIRTPLQSIIGFAEQLKVDSNGHTDAVNAIFHASDHLLHIVNDVLDYSRITSGKFSFDQKPFSLKTLLLETEKTLSPLAEKKGLVLLCEWDFPDDLALNGDVFRLRQIFYNLLNNSIKFTPSGFVRLEAQATIKENNVLCCFKITDSGTGMHKDEQKKVFLQFEQANADIIRNHGGTGLGLSIVKALTEGQGGTIDLQSEVGVGTTFTIQIPFEKASTAGLETHNTEQSGVHQPKLSGSVVVVDDDPMILNLCSLILKKYKVRFETHRDGTVLLKRNLPDDAELILLDIRMPTVNGADICRELRNRHKDRIRIVAFTAHVLPEEKETLLASGFDHILLKPFREKDLLGILGFALQKTTPSEESEFDLAQLRGMLDGDEVLLKGILDQLGRETDEDLLCMEACILKSDIPQMREKVHKLAGRIGQVGAKDITAQLKKMEVRLGKGVFTKEMKADLDAIAVRIRRILTLIVEEKSSV